MANLTPSCCVSMECNWVFWSADKNRVSVLNGSVAGSSCTQGKSCTLVSCKYYFYMNDATSWHFVLCNIAFSSLK